MSCTDVQLRCLKHRRQPKDANAAKRGTDLRQWAKTLLQPIERKLKGLYSPANLKERTYGGITTRGGQDEREISISNLVQMLIQEAVDGANLVSWLGFSAYRVSRSHPGQDVFWLGSMALRVSSYLGSLQGISVITK
jgi:hypothetical protein